MNPEVVSSALWTSFGLLSSQFTNLSNQYGFNLKRIHQEAKEEPLRATEAASLPKFNQLNSRIDLIKKHTLQISTKMQEMLEARDLEDKKPKKKRSSRPKGRRQSSDDDQSMNSYITSSSESSNSVDSNSVEDFKDTNEFDHLNTKSKDNI